MRRITAWLERRRERRETEFAKRMVVRILNCSLFFMGCSYLLAFLGFWKYGNLEIVENLSSTVASAIVGVMIPYLITKVIENVSKFGSRINRTAVEPERLIPPDADEAQESPSEEGRKAGEYL